ncbi:hypothetical protein M404DRAFT_1006696 [Pisolithus tinctorius Marx 270]|uniref:Uncharacterized protein n=1 Tax=Pisolithus tinctorius Marx 270 TaxID=870435 RepID=A0A0C3NM06_PISTI|nr:hypothetical protein M404DRAFT_1006696 [Pisolithus tinctorius Marx 270]
MVFLVRCNPTGAVRTPGTRLSAPYSCYRSLVTAKAVPVLVPVDKPWGTGTAGRNSTRVMVFPANERVITGNPQLWRRRKNKNRDRRRIVGIGVLHFWPPSVPQDKRFRANKGLCWPSCVSRERRQSQIYGTLRLVRAGTKTGQADD